MMIKKSIRCFTAVLSAACLCLFLLATAVSNGLPDSFMVTQGNELIMNGGIPVTASKQLGEEKPASVLAGENNGEHYKVDLNLFGIVPIKSAEVEVISAQNVIPLGDPFGVKIFTDGVLIVGITPVETEDGPATPAKEAGMQTGDVILAINGQTVATNNDVASLIEQCGGEKLSFSLRRDQTSLTVDLLPRKGSDGTYKAGLWVRDSSAGIGTLTFYYPENNVIAGLGHGVCDVDTGELLPVLTGELVGAQVLGVTKSQAGATGELKGRFNGPEKIATLLENCNKGVYGLCENGYSCNNQPVTVAMRQQVQTGDAQILCSADGTVRAYDINIVSIRLKDDDTLQNMVIEVTDSELLELTGGIVQGMSGSPILQNGMLVGAVTHVFVNQPTKGYAIFAETMLKEAQSFAQTTAMAS